MDIFWAEEAPFIHVFRGHHLVYVIGMLLLLLLILRYRKKVRRNRETIRKTLLFFAFIQQFLLYSWYIFETGFDLSESLPLHISRVSSILGIVFLLTKNKKVMDVLFYFGLYAYGSFIYPQRVYTFYHVIGISYFVNHALTILLPIFASISYNWRPSISALYQSFKWFLVYFTFVYFLNPLIDGNYFYLKHRPFFANCPDWFYVPLALLATFILFAVGYSLAKTIEKKTTRK